MEPAIGAFGWPFPGKHAGGIFRLTFEGKNARGIRKLAGHVFEQPPAQAFRSSAERRQRDFRNLVPRQGLTEVFHLDHLAAHFVTETIGAVARRPVVPAGQEIAAMAGQPRQQAIVLHHQSGLRRDPRIVPGKLRQLVPLLRHGHTQNLERAAQRFDLPCQLNLLRRPGAVIATCGRGFAEITLASRRQDGLCALGDPLRRRREMGWPIEPEFAAHLGDQVGIKSIDPRIVEMRRAGSEYRQLLHRRRPQLVVALVLATHVAQGVFRAAAGEFVDRHEVRVIEHVDLFELTRRAVFSRHHVDGHVAQIADARIPLADARGFDDHQIELALHRRDQVLEGRRNFAARLAGRHRTQVNPGIFQRIETDAIPQQCAAGFAAGGIDTKDRHLFVREIEEEPPHQLVGQARFAGTPGAGDAHHRCVVPRGHTFGGLCGLPELSPGQGPRQVLESAIHLDRPLLDRKIAAFDHLVDHALEAKIATVLRRKDAIDAGRVELFDLRRHDSAAAAAVDANVPQPHLVEALAQVLEKLHMPALVGGDRHPLGVFLQRRRYDFFHAAVVAEVDHLGSGRLHEPAHDADRRVVTVEKRRRSDDPDRIARLIRKNCRVHQSSDLRGAALAGRGFAAR